MNQLEFHAPLSLYALVPIVVLYGDHFCDAIGCGAKRRGSVSAGDDHVTVGGSLSQTLQDGIQLQEAVVQGRR